MMEAAPSPTFKMPEADFLLEFQVVALNAPTQLGEVDQTLEGDVRGKRRQKVFGRLGLVLGPLDQEPFFRARLVAPFVTPRGTHPHPRKARGHGFRRTFSPFDGAPGALGQAERKLFNRDWPVLVVAPQALWWASTAGPSLRRQRSRPVCPHRRVRQNARDVSQPQRRDIGAQIAVIAVTSIEQPHATRQTGRAGPAQLLQRDLMLGLEANIFRNPHLAQTIAIL